jgi:ATP-dependent exoDNAse (exonuclease V) beta subunit
MLYVSLTRAKRGLYVLLEPPSKSADPDKAALSNWITRSIRADSGNSIPFQCGSDDWSGMVPIPEPAPKPDDTLLPGAATPRRVRATPSGAKLKSETTPHSPAGMRFGNEVHALFEQIGWCDENTPTLPDTDAGVAVNRILQHPDILQFFQKGQRDITLLREQGTDLVLDGKLITGVIDRLHLHRNPSGRIHRVEIIDFKTDAVTNASHLAERYSAQMHAYRDAMQLIHPNAEIICILLSVRHCEIVVV